MQIQRFLCSAILMAAAITAIPAPAPAQCHTISIGIGSTGQYYQLLDSYQTFTMPSDGLVTGFTFYGVIPGGQSGNITYRVYRMPEDTLLATATIFETGVGETYYGVNFGYQSALYFAAGAQLKVRINGPSLTVLNKLYYANNNPYSGGVSSAAGGGPWDLACRLYTSVAPSLSFSFSSISFDTVPVGLPTTDTVVVTNPGCYTLSISSVTKTNSQISVTPTTASIGASGTQSFIVTYTPSGASSLVDSLTFVSDAPNGTVKVPLSGTGVFQAQTNAGNGLLGNGTNAYVATTSNPSIVNSSFTFEGWFKSTTSTPSGWFFGQGTANTNQGLHIGYIGSTSIRFGMWSDDVDYSSMTDAENWHHFAFTYNSSTKFQAIYRDGELVASRTANNNFTGSGTLSIGNIFGGGTTSCFAGTMDEVRLWNTSRTSAQIRENMHLSLAGNESGLLGYWRFDETSGTTAGDGTGHGYSATLQNSPTRTVTDLPLGAGESTHVTGITTGSTSVTGFSMGLVNDFDSVTDVLVTRIDSDPNELPTGSSTLLEGAYFIVRVFGTPGTFSSSVTFDVPAHFTLDGAANPGNYTLYSRGSNSTGSWSAAVTGLSVMNTTNITFNGLTSFSQFMVGTDNTLPVQMAGFSAQVIATGALLHWRTETEADNAGWFVERRDVSREYGVRTTEEAVGEWKSVGFVEGAGTSTSTRKYSFSDNLKIDNVTPSGVEGRHSTIENRFAYRLKQLDRSGAFSYSGEVEVEFGTAPKMFALSQNYPNPFNPTTKIEFTLPEDGKTALRVFNVLGQEVGTLFEGEVKAGTVIRSEFDAKGLASGMYFARLEYDGKQLMKRMMLMK